MLGINIILARSKSYKLLASLNKPIRSEVGRSESCDQSMLRGIESLAVPVAREV